MRIKMLNEETINKIAAGEVIVRPVSVIKELVENAIDAGSTRIKIAIEEGGKKRMVVADNGCGIPYNDVPLAFERHATSKIKNIDDLMTIDSLGFRGEALASICAVSRVKITTRFSDEELGSQTVFEDGQCINQRVTGHNRGTVIDVSDLFYTIPARKKHMAKGKTEASLIQDIVEKLALSHPDIAFTYESDGKRNFNTNGSGDLIQVIESIFGRNFANSLIDLNVENAPMSLRGYIGDLTTTRTSRDYQIFYINGRYVRNRDLSRAFQEAYEGYLMNHQYPIGIIFITLPGRMLDINIHPTKTEIGVLNQSLVYLLFKQGIRQTLRSTDLSIDIGTIDKSDENNVETHNTSKNIENEEQDSFLPVQQIIMSESPTTEKSTIVSSDPIINAQAPKAQFYGVRESETSTPYIAQVVEKEDTAIPPNKVNTNTRIDFSHYRIIGQLFNTYILLEKGNEAVLLDQHAAHEAFMFEELRKRFEETSDFPSQRLLVPISVTVEARVFSEFEQIKEKLIRYGFDCDVFGENELLVRSVPIILGEPQEVNLINTFLEESFHSTDIQRDQQISRIITMSCKAAVKGNQVLNHSEIKELLDKIATLDNPFTCPHGRPIIFRLKQYELEKLFKRVI